jgi:hypothetical protein
MRVLIERLDTNLCFKNPVKVFHNFDSDMLIGLAIVSKGEEGYLYADITTKGNHLLEMLYPSILIKPIRAEEDTFTAGELKYISLCDAPNIDSYIPKVGEQLYYR